MNAYQVIQTAGINDPMFHYENFPNLPVTLIVDMIKAIAKRDRYLANIHSITVAKIGLGFVNKKGVSIEAFLPFDLSEDAGDKVSLATAKEFFRCVEKGLIPKRIVPAFSPFIDRMKLLVGQ